MAAIKVRNLRDDLSFGAVVEGLDWSNIEDEAVREQIRETFRQRGMIVFPDMEPSAKMQVAVSKIFGPLKDHPTKTTPRDDETGDAAQGVIDMFHAGTADPDYRRRHRHQGRHAPRPLFALAFRPLLQRRTELCRRAAFAGQFAGRRGGPHRLHGRDRSLPAAAAGPAREGSRG